MDENPAPQVDEPVINDTDNEVLPNEVEQVVEAPAEEVITETEEVEEDYQPVQIKAPEMQSPLLDFSKLPADENGNIDPQALADAMQQRDQTILQQAANLVQQAEERRQEEQLWNKAFEKYPDLKKDKALAEEVQAIRFGLFASEINSGKEAKMLSPAQAFERVNKRFAAQRAEGQRQATENTRIEESVYVEPTSNAPATTANDEDNLFRQMRSPDRVEADKAGFDFLKKRLFGG